MHPHHPLTQEHAGVENGQWDVLKKKKKAKKILCQGHIAIWLKRVNLVVFH